MNSLTLHFKKLEEEETKSKVRREEITKIKADINEIETIEKKSMTVRVFVF